jgi:hypothetical protein
VQLPLWPAMTRRSGSHDRGDGEGTACGRSREHARMLSSVPWRSPPSSNSPPSNGSPMLGLQRKIRRSTATMRRHPAFAHSILSPPSPPPIARAANTAAPAPGVEGSSPAPR